MGADQQALSLQWAFGFSCDISNGVADVSESGQHKICYVAAHTAVIYDRIERQQMVLQGHCNPITCLAVTEDKSVLVTADAGDDAMVVLWRTATGQPAHTIDNPFPGGCVAMDLSPDGLLLVLLSAPATFETEEGTVTEQSIGLWDLSETGSLDAPAAIGSIPAGDVQTCVRFSQEDPSQIVTNGKQRVYFWRSHLGVSREFKYYSPPVSARDFKQTIGDFTVSVFIPGTLMAVSGTVDGDVVLWEEGNSMREAGARPSDRRAVKILRIHLEGGITSLTSVDRFIVSGGSDGCVRFYDAKLRLAAWFDDMHAGPITSISFSPSKSKSVWESDSHDKFSAPDFLVGTSKSRVVCMKTAAFKRMDVPKSGEQVLEGVYGHLAALAAHPLRPEFSVSGDAGVLWAWNYSSKQLVSTREFEKLRISHLVYSSDGASLIVGCTNGTLRILDPNSLADKQAFRFATTGCVRLAVSGDCCTIAMADESGMVGVVTYGHGRSKDKWEFVGKHGSHTGLITGLVFEGLGQVARLWSVGEDGVLVEYDLQNTSVGAGVQLVKYTDVGRGAAIPTALAVAPASEKAASGRSIITADSAFKFRTYDSVSQVRQRTVISPTYGGPPVNMQVFHPAGQVDKPLLAYSTNEKMVGLCAFPLDGDPHKAMGLIAHPGEVSALAVTYDGRRILTAGGADSIINMWGVDANALEAQYKDRDPHENCHVALLEGGRKGDFFQEMKDYFYYAQIHTQGEDTTAPRKIEGTVELTVVPNLMRALGYYPSESEVGDMMVELQQEAADKGLPDPTVINFERFITLYVNHRPVFGVGKDQLAAAFQALGADPYLGTMDCDDLLQALTGEGEPMSHSELEECLQALTGSTISSVYDIIPPQVEAKQFAEDILGFEDYAVSGEA
mmetsp:Transcript_33102/g.55453  ORF Transcript_33102/g.55453 Transcript_33102/m.55453 type:complete len:898 (-) Transcript_33102:322-3015(-)|eukprot:CAMPEP_0198208724 /NCGR_PEP_ID=MMETSP1445-20131203/12072_1 /TAXON_ID=36898 /ORGANISM="Pyramimonas sp., Strain CCMP2087" /LENGTH=897 /DNA_ID=CAMNT_0043882237 /DNA_START=386 /DNA_END=3079 /DNA_ORIENTATION=+